MFALVTRYSAFFNRTDPEVTVDISYPVAQVEEKKRREIRLVLLERQRKEWLGSCQVHCQLDRLRIIAWARYVKNGVSGK